MKQEQNQIYNAFKEAGLEKEARKLSETIKDNKGKNIVVPALGHYIAIVDNILELEAQTTERLNNLIDYRKENLFSESITSIFNYAEQFNKDLFSKLKTFFHAGNLQDIHKTTTKKQNNNDILKKDKKTSPKKLSGFYYDSSHYKDIHEFNRKNDTDFYDENDLKGDVW